MSVYLHKISVSTAVHVHLFKIAPGLLYLYMYMSVYVHKISVSTAVHVHVCKIAPGLLYLYMYMSVYVHKSSVRTRTSTLKQCQYHPYIPELGNCWRGKDEAVAGGKEVCWEMGEVWENPEGMWGLMLTAEEGGGGGGVPLLLGNMFFVTLLFTGDI